MNNKTILLVDDEKIIRETISKDLQEEGYGVTTAVNGESAIAMLKQQGFDLVVTDLMMSGLDGLQVLKQAKKTDPELPVIILTGYGDMTSAIDAIRFGADDYMLKPFDINELFVRISRCLEKQVLLQQLKVQNQQLLDEIAARKQVEDSLKEHSEKIKLFAYSVAHDLKTPAIALHGLTKLLCEKHIDTLTGKVKKLCGEIQRSSERIVTLSDTINVFVSTKETPLSIEKISLKEVLQIIREEFSSQLINRTINWVEPVNLPDTIFADRVSILRVLRNLIDNAFKYAGENFWRIEIGYEETDDFHILSVTDNGKGIKNEDGKNIFGVFQRQADVQEIHGTGLGLAIVKEIIELHKGKAWVESNPQGGTIFYVSISKHLT